LFLEIYSRFLRYLRPKDFAFALVFIRVHLRSSVDKKYFHVIAVNTS